MHKLRVVTVADPGGPRVIGEGTDGPPSRNKSKHKNRRPPIALGSTGGRQVRREFYR